MSKFDEGDEVILKITGTVQQIDDDDDTVLVTFEGAADSMWFDETSLAHIDEDSEDPLRVTDFVRQRGGNEKQSRIGKIKAIHKGQAWIDWSADEEVASGTQSITSLVRVTLEQAREQGWAG